MTHRVPTDSYTGQRVLKGAQFAVIQPLKSENPLSLNVNPDTEFGLEGVTFSENIDPGPFRKLFMISDGRKYSNGIIISWVVIFLSFMPGIGGLGRGLPLLVLIPMIFVFYSIPVYFQDWAMDEKFGTSFRNFLVDEEE